MNDDRLLRVLSRGRERGFRKTAFNFASLLPALANSAIFMPSAGRMLGSMNTKRKADNAWSDALQKDPLKALVPGLEEEFKKLYFESPHSAEILLEVF